MTRTIRALRRHGAIALALAAVASGCGDDDDEPAPAASEETHWAYSGENGPSRWAELDAEFAACDGSSQSPLALERSSAAPAHIADPVVRWRPADVEIVNTGHTVQVNVPAGMTTTLDGREFGLDQLHWHRPSEHTLDDDAFAMELHFVHHDAEGTRAVLSVLLTEGDANPVYDDLWERQPEIGQPPAHLTSLDLRALLPDDLTTITYPGSLTTPPCSEGVLWNVLVTPATISSAQVEGFLYDGNARPVQQLDGRTVRVDDD